MNKPELLAPGGNLEKLKIAILYGADAVYIGGEAYSLRVAADNFSLDDMKEGLKFAHDRGKKVYLTANILPHNSDIAEFEKFITEVRPLGFDGILVADLGIFDMVQKLAPEIPIHISTQANNVNYMSARKWYEMGAKRVVLAREMSFEEIREIREKTPADLELEAFVHGAMCMSFSGRCTLSNYLTGRDANRGDCAQPCRWKYYLMEEKRPGEYFPINEEKEGAYIFNSRDLCMIEHIPELVDAGIDSFKIEGRAKSEYYTAMVTYAYRAAIDEYLKNPSADFVLPDWIKGEIDKISHRKYTTGFYFGPIQNGQVTDNGGYERAWDVCAVYKSCENGKLTVEQRNRFFDGEELEVVEPFKKPYKITVQNLFNEKDEEFVSVANKATDVYSFSVDREISSDAVFRRKRD